MKYLRDVLTVKENYLRFPVVKNGVACNTKYKTIVENLLDF